MNPATMGIDTGGGGFSGSSGVSGDDEQSSGGQRFGGLSLGNFGSKTVVNDDKSTLYILLAVVAVVFLMMRTK